MKVEFYENFIQIQEGEIIFYQVFTLQHYNANEIVMETCENVKGLQRFCSWPQPPTCSFSLQFKHN